MRKIAYLILTAVSFYLCIMYDGAAPFYLLGFLLFWRRLCTGVPGISGRILRFI